MTSDRENARVDEGVESTREGIRPHSGRRGGARGALVVLILISLVVASSAGWAGMRLRAWLWNATQTIRFRGDITNGFRWGLRVCRSGQELVPTPEDDASGRITWKQFFAGYRNLYDRDLAGQTMGTGWTLDYAPLRLLAMSLWVKHVLATNPGAVTWQHDDVWPLLRFNEACEFTSAILMFFLVKLWIARSRDSTGTDVRAWIGGLLAGLLVWFNPAMTFDAHAWPQWDVWCMPFFIGAVLCCSLEWWLTAGVLISLGAMFKGQILLAAPVLLLWPIFSWRLGAALRLIIGALCAAAVVGAPWIIDRPLPLTWVASVALAAILAYPWRRLNLVPSAIWILRVAALGLVIWPWFRAGAWMWSFVGVLLAASLVFVPRGLAPRTRPYLYAGMFVVSMAFCCMLFDGSVAWFEIGVTRAATHYDWMAGSSVGNLPAIMERSWNWSVDDTLLTIPALRDGGTPTGVSVDTGLTTLYVIGLILCGIGAARHAAARDVRFLVAVAAPWVLFYALLPRMHERYLTWFAVMSAAGVGMGVGMTFLHVLIAGLALCPLLHTMLRKDASVLPDLRSFVNGLYPDIGWLIVFLACVYVYLSLAPSRRRPNKLPYAAPLPGFPVEPVAAQPQEIALPDASPAQA